jgi:hypothetical protein
LSELGIDVGADFLERMIGRKSTFLRQLAGGCCSDVVRFGRFLANPSITVDRLVEGWGKRIGPVCSGRHILAIQDTSEVNLRTTATQGRGLGKIRKGMGHGLLLHAMLAVDADSHRRRAAKTYSSCGIGRMYNTSARPGPQWTEW